MQPGDPVPATSFTATGNINASFADFQGKWLVLYFYPKDATPGCTIEGRDFRDAYLLFKALNAEIFGISRDTLTSHDNFKCKQDFPFELINDEQETLCELFDVIKIKSMYGKQMRGIERSTFLIDPQGLVKKVWRRVKVVGHVDEVREALEALQS